MDFSVAVSTDRDLLSIDRSQYPVKTCWFSPVRELSYVPNMMHNDLLGTFSADAASFS